ncbi:MAG: hypothetical protein WBW94_10955 [Anaerolineales bacterium]
MFTKIFAMFFKTVILLIIATLLTPAAYFAYRSTQPMTLPEFHGLTYIQVVQWRTIAYANLEAKYAQEHPHADGTPQNGYLVNSFTCEGELRIITFTASVLQSWLYTFSSWQNDQNRVEMLKANYLIPNEPVTTWNFMSWWWTSYEMIIFSNIQYQPEMSVPYCRIQPDIPTPAQLQAMTTNQ